MTECQIKFMSIVGPRRDIIRLSHTKLSDSGTITEESTSLGFPAVMVRQAHERPEGMDEGAVIMTGLNPDGVLQAVKLTLAQFKKLGPGRIPPDYNVAQVPWKVAKFILSYTDYVNRRVWQKG